MRNLDYSLTLVFDMETEDLKFERRVGEMIVPHTEDRTMRSYVDDLGISELTQVTMPVSAFYDDQNSHAVRELEIPNRFEQKKGTILPKN